MSANRKPFRILFVCMGNICRSPAADIVFHRVAADAGLDGRVMIDSAGTHGYHTGSPPDHRMAATLRKRGYTIHGKARHVKAGDLDDFDLVLAMDADNERELLRLATPANRHKVRRFTDFCSQHSVREVPDPYYGGPAGFEHVADIIEDGCAGLLENAKRQLSEPGQ